jgi:hypothetical protein
MNRSFVRFAAAGAFALATAGLWLTASRAAEPPAKHETPAAEKAVVVTHPTSLMVGYKIVAPVAVGQRLNVVSTKDGWIGTFVEGNGRKTYGWLWGEFAAHGETPIAAAPNTRRSFSFDPSENSAESGAVMAAPVYPQRSFSGGNRGYSGRTSSRTPLYLLPKGDPRKTGGR